MPPFANKVENILYLLKYCPAFIAHLYFFIFQLVAEVIYFFPYLDGDLFLTFIMNIYYLLQLFLIFSVCHLTLSVVCVCRISSF